MPTQEEEIKKRILLLIDSYDKETDKRRKEIWLKQIERDIDCLLNKEYKDYAKENIIDFILAYQYYGGV